MNVAQNPVTNELDELEDMLENLEGGEDDLDDLLDELDFGGTSKPSKNKYDSKISKPPTGPKH